MHRAIYITCIIYFYVKADQHVRPVESFKGHQEGGSVNNLHPQHDHHFHHKDQHEHIHHQHIEDSKKQHHEHHEHGMHHHHHHHHNKQNANLHLNINYKTYVYSLASTLLISVAPILLIFLLPNLASNSVEESPLLNILLSFASGGLLGDAFLHLIPHSLLEYSEISNTDDLEDVYNIVGLRVLTGILAFLAVDKIIRMLKIGGGASIQNALHSHSKHEIHLDKLNFKDNTLDTRVLGDDSSSEHGSKASSKTSSPFIVEDLPLLENPGDNVYNDQTNPRNVFEKSGLRLRRAKGNSGDRKTNIDDIGASSENPKQPTTDAELESLKDTDETASFHSRTPPCFEEDIDDLKKIPNYGNETRKMNLKTAAYLNLAADFAHNFTDGLAISASYMAGNSVGLLATSTILLHEVPHEIGDYAILIQSGCSKNKAIMLQFITAIGALSGTLLGLVSKQFFHKFISTMWILPFTAGGFIYIATVTILPELLNTNAANATSKSICPYRPLLQALAEIGALLLGILLMLILIQYE